MFLQPCVRFTCCDCGHACFMRYVDMFYASGFMRRELDFFMLHVPCGTFDCKNNTHYHEPCSNNYLCRVAVRNDIRFLGRACRQLQLAKPVHEQLLRRRRTSERATRSLSILFWRLSFVLVWFGFLLFLSRRFVTSRVLSFGSCRLSFLLSACHGESLTKI